MRVVRMLLVGLVAGAGAACGSTPKTYVPVDSTLKPWQPEVAEAGTGDAEGGEEGDNSPDSE